jgi:hypothetical protein
MWALDDPTRSRFPRGEVGGSHARFLEEGIDRRVAADRCAHAMPPPQGGQLTIFGHRLGREEGGREGARVHVGYAVELRVVVHVRVDRFACFRLEHDGPMLCSHIFAPAYVVLDTRSGRIAGMEAAMPVAKKHVEHGSWRGGKRRLVGPPARYPGAVIILSCRSLK